MEPVLDDDADRLGESGRLVEPGFDVAPIGAAEIGQGDKRSRSATHILGFIAVEDAQADDSSSCISARLIGFSG